VARSENSVLPSGNPDTALTPKKDAVKGPAGGENPLAVTSAETTPLLAAPELLLITMSPLSVQVGEQEVAGVEGGLPGVPVSVADMSRVMRSARAAPAAASAITTMVVPTNSLRNVENIVTP
jgi:hypothetical protein